MSLFFFLLRILLYLLKYYVHILFFFVYSYVYYLFSFYFVSFMLILCFLSFFCCGSVTLPQYYIILQSKKV